MYTRFSRLVDKKLQFASNTLSDKIKIIMPSTADIILGIVAAIVFIWDFLTWPIYQAIYKPWEKRKAIYTKKRSRVVR